MYRVSYSYSPIYAFCRFGIRAAVAVGILATLGLAHPALAADFSVSPLIIDEQGAARDIIKETVILTNSTNHLLTLYASVNNIDADAGAQKFADPTRADLSRSLANWIEITRGVIELQPAETRKIAFLIDVNLTAVPGKYHAAISFATGQSRAEAEHTPHPPQVAVNLEISDTARGHLILTKFVPARTLVLSDSATFDFDLQNNGSKEAIPRGQVRIYDRAGQELAELDANAENNVIDPKTTKHFKVDWKGFSVAAAGQYKAFLDLEYDDTDHTRLTDTAYVYVLSWQFALALVFVLFVAITSGILFFYRKRLAVHPSLAYVHDSRMDDGSPRISARGRDRASDRRSDFLERWDEMSASRSGGVHRPPRERRAIYDAPLPRPERERSALRAFQADPVQAHEVEQVKKHVQPRAGHVIELPKFAHPHPQHVLHLPKKESLIHPKHIVDLKSHHKRS